MTPNEYNKSPKSKNKNNSKAGSVHENIEIDDKSLDHILHNNTLLMVLAIQFISNDRTVWSDTVRDLKEINNQSLATQAKKGDNWFLWCLLSKNLLI